MAGLAADDRVMTHSLPLRVQGAWAEWSIWPPTPPPAARPALGAVKDGGRLATITSDPPDAERGIEVKQVYVAPDGPRLARLGELLAAETIGVTVSAPFPLESPHALGPH